MLSSMFGLDPATIENLVAQAETAIRDMDSRLEAIENESRTQTVLLAMIVAELYGVRTGHGADLSGVLASARGVPIDVTAMDAAKPEPDPAGPLPSVPIVHSGKSPDVQWSPVEPYPGWEPSEDDGA